MRSLGVVVCLAVLGIGAQAQTPTAVADHERAFLVGPGTVLCGPIAQEPRWSFDGRYVLMKLHRVLISREAFAAVAARRQTEHGPTVEHALVLVDADAGKAELILPRMGSDDPGLDCGWLTGSHVGVAVARSGSAAEPRSMKVTLIDAGSRKTRTLLEVGEGSLVLLDFDLTAPRVLVRTTGQVAGEPRRTGWFVVDRTGNKREVASSALPGPVEYMTWTHDGKLLARTGRPGSAPDRKASVRWWIVEPLTFAVREIERPAMPTPVERDSALRVVASEQEVRHGEARGKVNLLWLETTNAQGPDRALLCADGDWGSVSPSRSHVLWSARGVAWIAPIASIPLSKYRELQDAAARTALMSKGKQVALAIMMYAQDHDETLPEPEQMPSGIEPYIKGAEVLRDFVYALRGGKIADYAAPATTEMGHITGPGGKAIVFLDGHVEWRND